MKVEIYGISGAWWWSCIGATSLGFYTRRRDAVRGFERFCARVRAM